MDYKPENFGVIGMAKYRGKTRDEVTLLLGQQNHQCWCDLNYPGSCNRHGKQMNAAEAAGAHIKPYSEGGDECVAMCHDCNQLQGRQHLRHFVLVLAALQEEYNANTKFL